jgi:hypothetical protein
MIYKYYFQKEEKEEVKDFVLDHIIQNDNEICNELENIFEKKNKNYQVQQTYSNSLNTFEYNTSLPKVFMNIKVNNRELGQIVIKLFTNVVPKTCENFRALCSGERGYSNKGRHLSYKNSIFHRIIPNFMIQVLLMEMVLVHTVYMEILFQMKVLKLNTINLELCLWQIMEKIQMDANSLS